MPLFIKRLLFSLCNISTHLFLQDTHITDISYFSVTFIIMVFQCISFLSYLYILTSVQTTFLSHFPYVLYLMLPYSFTFIDSILLFLFQNATQSTSFSIFLFLSSSVRILLHTFLVCDTIFLLHSFLSLRGAASTAIHAIFFFLSSFLFLSSHCSEDCRAISVGSNVMWKMHCPRALDRIICIRGVCISTVAYTGTVYIR